MVHRTSQSLPTNFQLITNNQQIIRHMKLKKKINLEVDLDQVQDAQQ